MRILGVDTSTARASVALVEDERLILEQVKGGPPGVQCPTVLPERTNHAEVLLPLMEGLLTRAGWALDQLSAVAVAIGPGSFTGLRIAVSTVKGLAYGSCLPIVGVPTLAAVATRVRDWQGWICPFSGCAQA